MEMNETQISLVTIAVAVVVLALLARGIWAALGVRSVTVNEGQRGVFYRNGVFEREQGPGKYWTTAGTLVRPINVNEISSGVPAQEVLSKDRLSVKLSAIATYKVREPRKALETAAEGYYTAIYQVIQLALRDVAAELPLEELIDQRTTLDAKLADKVRAGFAHQGCELVSISVRDVILPGDIRRLATEAVRARLEAAASLERARGEQASLRALANAARLLKGNPELMNLRVLQALSSAPGKTAPTIILSGGAGIVPVPTASGELPADTPDQG